MIWLQGTAGRQKRRKLQKKKLTKKTKRFILFLLRGRQTKRFVNMLQAVPNKFFNNQQS
ncbi:MAG: hypothetical protein ACI83P_001045, partial [Janthinobacterium sp.]